MNITFLQFVLAVSGFSMFVFQLAALLSKSRNARQEERLRELEQKVETISRHLNLPSTPVLSQFSASKNTSWNGAASSSLSARDNDEVVRLLRANRKIEAIKLYRERTCAGLKEAVGAVKAIERSR